MFSGLISRCTIPAAWATDSALANCPRDLQRLVRRNRPLHQAFTERLAVDELGRDVVGGFDLSDLVNGHDVGMVQSRSGACFAFQPFEVRLVRDEGLR